MLNFFRRSSTTMTQEGTAWRARAMFTFHKGGLLCYAIPHSSCWISMTEVTPMGYLTNKNFTNLEKIRRESFKHKNATCCLTFGTDSYIWKLILTFESWLLHRKVILTLKGAQMELTSVTFTSTSMVVGWEGKHHLSFFKSSKCNLV